MQNIISKIDKKVLIIVCVILIVVLIAGFFIYRYSKDLEKTVQNEEGEVKIETPSKQIIAPREDPQIETQTQPGLIICADKCGDGVCQPAGTICEDNLNCICAETKIDCPQDCKN